MPVKEIDRGQKRQLVRNSLEQIATGEVPIVGPALIAISRILSPSALDTEIERWRVDVTRSVNSLEAAVEKLSGHVKISDLALRIGVRIATESELGIPEPVSIDLLSNRFPDAAINQFIDACGELEYAGLAEIHSVVGNWGSLCTKILFFESFDPFIFTWHPVVDAAHLANYVAEQSSKGGSAVSAENMAKHFKWGARRLNPPLMIVANHIAEGRKFTGYATPWACRHMYADPAERAALRNFTKGVIGE